MANENHLQVLSMGTNSWNEWRSKNPDVAPDLSGANLESAYLSETNPPYRSPPSTQIDFSRVDLSRSNLRSAVLKGANLREAKLYRADLYRADLRRANLAAADLRYAWLNRADLTLAVVRNTNFEQAVIWETVLARVDLSQAQNLELCRHGGPSIVDQITFRKSKSIPVEFLHGCGLADWQIEISRLNQKGLSSAQITNLCYEAIALRSDPALQFYSCFISHSSKDKGFAAKLYNQLQSSGVRCWFAPKNLKIGDRFRDVIHDVIRDYDKLILILSRHSIESQWVEDEVERAIEMERRQKKVVLFPITLDDAVYDAERGWPVTVRNSRHIGDFRKVDGELICKESLERLLSDLLDNQG